MTGDKLETAIEIAKSCRIIETNTYTVVLTPPGGENTDYKSIKNMLVLKAREIKAWKANGKRPSRRRKSVKEEVKTDIKDIKQENVVLVIEGSTLAMILGNKGLEELFFQMGLTARSVICCRVSPKQKASVVSLYK